MRHRKMETAFIVMALGSFAGCSTTARYVTAEHWSKGDTFYVGFTEYKETNLVVTKIGKSSAHVMLCNAADTNNVQCKPQLAVDRLLNPGQKYPDAPAAPAQPTAPEAPQETSTTPVSQGSADEVPQA